MARGRGESEVRDCSVGRGSRQCAAFGGKSRKARPFRPLPLAGPGRGSERSRERHRGGAVEQEEDDMPRKVTLWGPLAAAIVATALYVGTVRATPAAGFVGTTLAQGRIGDIDVFNHLVLPQTAALSKRHRHVWLSWQKTKGDSDIYVQNNVWQPGGSTG